MATFSNRGLPIELTDLVIDYLEGDKPSLEAASRVCRSWSPRSRHHLFHTVHVKAGLPDFPYFLRFIRGEAGATDFAAVVSSHIRELHLCGSGRTDRRPQEDDLAASTISPELILALLDPLTELQSLTLEAVRLDMRTSSVGRRAAGAFRLQSLTLEHITTISSTGDDLPHFLSQIGRAHV